MDQTQKAIWIFIGIVLIVNGVLSGLIIFDGGGLEGNIPYALGLMYSPALIGIGIQVCLYKSVKGFGWQVGPLRHFMTAYFVPIGYIAFAYLLLVLFGIIQLDLSSFTVLDLVQVLLINPLLLTLLVVGEELGWRGFLLPKLCEVTTYRKASLTVGMIWVVVHYPILMFSDYGHASTPLLYQMLNFTCLALSVNVVINYLRMTSGSVLTAILFHAVHNSVLQDVNQLIIPDRLSDYFISETGAALAIVALLMVLVTSRVKGKMPLEQVGMKCT